MAPEPWREEGCSGHRAQPDTAKAFSSRAWLAGGRDSASQSASLGLQQPEFIKFIFHEKIVT